MSITGVEAVNSKLTRLISQIIVEAEKGAMLTQENIVKYAKNIAPIGTPSSTGIPDYQISEAYKRSVRRQPPTRKTGMFIAPVVAGGWIINPNTGVAVNYAIQLEYGHSQKQAPDGILLPSMYQSKGYFIDQVKRHTESKINEFNKRRRNISQRNNTNK